MSVKAESVTWILVADRARALFFKTSKSDRSDIELMRTLENPDGQKKPQEIYTDRPGRFFDNKDHRSAADPKTDVRHQTADDLASKIVDDLNKARSQNQFQHIVFVAPPLLLGAIRNKCDGPLAKCVSAELDLELANLPDHEIKTRLQKKLCEGQKDS